MAIPRGRESKANKKARCERIIAALRAQYGPVECTLLYVDDPWRLLVGGILAAQCTDERVNQVTPALFEVYPQVQDFARSSPQEIEPYVKTCGLFRNKAKWIFGSAQMITHQYDGAVPRTREELMKLPGVGRKIANLIMGDCYGEQAIVVDTHNGRISRLLGLTKHENPLKIEKDLQECVPEEHWTEWGHLMVAHGREICIARRPKCNICPVQPDCRTGSQLTDDE